MYRETVSSVGLFFSRNFPFTTGNTAIKYFRHALALDEVRQKTWFKAQKKYQFWVVDSIEQDSSRTCFIGLLLILKPHSRILNLTVLAQLAVGLRMSWRFGSQDVTAVFLPVKQIIKPFWKPKKIDVGGGDTPQGTPTLSDITLRWMIREIVSSQCGIFFDENALAAANIPLSMIGLSAAEAQLDDKLRGAETDAADGLPSPLYSPQAAKLDSVDAIQSIHDPLQSQPSWWALEVIPFFVSWQDQNGVWHRSWRFVRFHISFRP